MKMHLVVFNDKKIRRALFENEWYFAVVDLVAGLTDSDKPRDYWYRMKKRERESSGLELSTLCRQLKLPSSDGKKYLTEVANTEGLSGSFSPSRPRRPNPSNDGWPKSATSECRTSETRNFHRPHPRAYRAKGYSEKWIEKRMRGIAIRAELTDEWKNREVGGEPEYAILTAEISIATFGLTPAEYKEMKELDRENLRDHMTDLELIFSMLGEAATTEIARTQDAQGFNENRTAAGKGGKIAGEAREKLELESGRRVVSGENYLDAPEKRKRLEKKEGR